MKLVHLDRSEGFLRLRLDTLDDLWCVRTLLAAGDHVTAQTMRTAETQGDRVRETKAPKRPVRLTVEARDVEWHDFDDHVRVLGPITAGPFDVGKHHTIMLTPDGMDVEISKRDGVQDWHVRLVRQAEATSQEPHVLLLAVDDSEAQFATVRSYGLQRVGTLQSGSQGKRYAGAEEAKRRFYDETMRSLRLLRRPPDLPCMVVGPGWWREEFVAHVQAADPALAQGLETDGTSQGGRAGLQEALRRGLVQRLAQESRVTRETELVERVLAGLAGRHPVAIGAEEVKRAVTAGAAEDLLITDVQVRGGAHNGLLMAAESARATLVIVSTRHEAGERLDRLGGLAALLRFALPDPAPT